jgi:uncharacterized protein (TIGR02145 family)
MKNFALAASLTLACLLATSCGNHSWEEFDEWLNGSSSSEEYGGGFSDKGNDIANYRTVKIGNQIWMAENLNYNVSGSKCYGEGGKVEIYKTNTNITLSNAEVQANCNKYGRLYNWATAMALPDSCNNSSNCALQVRANPRGICPSGWHIPSDTDWDALMEAVGGIETAGTMITLFISAGTKLKATNGWTSYSGVPAGTDIYGFSALPGGSGFLGRFNSVGYDGTWWSVGYNCFAREWSMRYYSEYVYYLSTNERALHSVRCLQDSPCVGGSSSSGGGGFSDKGNDIANYRTVKIGTQTWMAENLNYNVSGSKCYGEGGQVCNSEVQANCNKYGRLYDWSTAMTACPSGWHIPSHEEWKTLIDFVGDPETAGTKLKATSGWASYSGVPAGTDIYGFSALPGGYSSSDGSFNYGLRRHGYWWSSSDWYWTMDNHREQFGWYSDSDAKKRLYSVRCLKDD